MSRSPVREDSFSIAEFFAGWGLPFTVAEYNTSEAPMDDSFFVQGLTSHVDVHLLNGYLFTGDHH